MIIFTNRIQARATVVFLIFFVFSNSICVGANPFQQTLQNLVYVAPFNPYFVKDLGFAMLYSFPTIRWTVLVMKHHNHNIFFSSKFETTSWDFPRAYVGCGLSRVIVRYT
jgi:hypothetical protein